jgi:DNA-binding beta-propeller fold protein YncE
MPTTAEEAAGRRLALVVATGSYADPTLAKLRAPGRDASDLATVLGDAAVGGFEVEMVLDAPAESLRRRIAQFCAQIGPHDLALVYLSCHGVLDDRGRLYYATADTDRALLSATAVPSAWLNEQLEDCRSRRQILVLDCCHSGAFAKGAKGEGELALRDRFGGRGRVVLTGSRGTEYSFEHDDVVGDSVSSVFTSALVEGLRSGDADRDGDGLVTVGELYDYAYEAVRTKEGRQTPTLWTYGAEGDLLVAHSPRGPIVKPAPLPEDLAALLESARPRVREGAVAELAELVQGSDAGRALTARDTLERVAAEDVPSVAAAARAALEAVPAEAGPQPPQPSAPTSPPGPPSAPPPSSTPASADPPAPADPRPVHRRLAIAGGGAAIVAAVIAIVIAIGGEDQSGPETFHLGGSPRGVAVGGGAWIARHAAEEVTRINSSSDRETFPVGPHPGKIAAGGGTVWVGYDQGAKLARVFPEAKEAPRIPFAEGSIAELAIADGRLWVSSGDAHTITAFDPQTGEEIRKYGPIDGFEGVFALDKNAMWAVGLDEESGEAQLTRIDIKSGEKKLKFHRAGSYFSGVAYGDERVWIADSNRNLVTAYRTPTRSSDVVEIASGIYEDDIAFAGDSVLVWDPVEGTLNRIDTNPPKLVEQQKIQGYKKHEEINQKWSALSVGDEFAWVTDPAKGTVHKVDYHGP